MSKTTILLQFLIFVFVLGNVPFVAADFGGYIADLRLSPVLTPSDAGIDKIDPAVLEAFASGEEEVKVFVNLRDRDGEVPDDRIIVDSVLRTIPDANIKDSNPEVILGYFTENDVFKVIKSKRVLNVEIVKYVRASLEDVTEIVGANQVWEMDVNSVPLTGAGKSVCVVDHGIDFDHPDLTDKNILGCNLLCPGDNVDGDCPMNCSQTDTNGHGTHVAGIVAADIGIEGVGKGVDLIALKVFPDGEEFASAERIYNAVIWCRDHKAEYNIGAISMSLGEPESRWTEPCDGSFLTFKINQIVNDFNLPVIIATGNEGFRDGINWPSCASGAIPVAASTKQNDVWPDSNYNDLVKLFAPGELTNSTCSQHDVSCDGGIYDRKDGTSMSTPAVAGAIAIIGQVNELLKNATMHPKNEIEPLLFTTGDAFGGLDPGRWTRLNIFDAVLELLPPPPECVEDIDGSGAVDFGDILAILSAWGNVGGPEDLDGSGVVDFGDLLVILSSWGPCDAGATGDFDGDKPSIDELRRLVQEQIDKDKNSKSLSKSF